MRFGSVCSGIESASVAWHPIGWKAAWLAEIEKFPAAVLAHHYPEVPNLGDMTALPARIAAGEVEAPDIFCGGTPCQAFSIAGLRKSLDDARGNLSLVFCEIANAIDTARAVCGRPPAVIFWENVPGVLSTKDNAFGCFLAGLAGENGPLEPPGGKWTNAGCVSGPQRTVAWRVLDAQYFGVAQRRRRVFVIASARKGFDPATVLFEWDGVRRDTAPSREARQVAPTIPARSTAGGGLGTDFDCDGGTICVATGQAGAEIGADMAPTLNCNQAPYVAHSLRGEGFDASEDGTGRGTPLVPVAYATKLHNTSSNQAGKFYENYTASLDANSPPPAIVFDTTQITSAANRSTTVVQQPVAYGIRTANTSSNGWGVQEECTHTLDCAQGVAVAQPVAFHPTQDPISSTDGSTHALGCGSTGGQASVAVAHVSVMPTMTAGGPSDTSHNQVSGQMRDAYMVPTTAMQVRRLTPVECERLQGFPDNWTLIPWRGKPADQCPDGPRYKALGNSWAIPCVSWIGKRIQVEVDRG